jgi:hypothetical protein
VLGVQVPLEEGITKADSDMLAYTAAATAQIHCSQRSKEILSAFCEDYMIKRTEARGDHTDTSLLNISFEDISLLP